jgi:predicted nucleic acid-binding protein
MNMKTNHGGKAMQYARKLANQVILDLADDFRHQIQTNNYETFEADSQKLADAVNDVQVRLDKIKCGIEDIESMWKHVSPGDDHEDDC